MKFSNFIHLILCFIIASVTADSDLTIDLPAGREECFYHTTKSAGLLEVEYQVIDGGDLDINFRVETPSGSALLQEFRKTDGVHKFNIQEQGDYAICLDNTFSSYSSKVIFFEIVTDEPVEDHDEMEQYWGQFDKDTLVDMKVEHFRTAMDKMKQNLEKSQQVQNFLRAYESKDRSIVESNFTRVNFFSGLQLFVMLSVGLIQVLMVRSLFEDKSKSAKNFKAKT